MDDPPNTNLMVDEIITLTKKFSCADNRISFPSPDVTPEETNLNLIGKVVSSKSFSSVVIRDIIARAWNTTQKVVVSKMDLNIFIFSFENLADLENVFRRCPWTFRGAHLVLKRWALDLLWQEMDFSRSTFWVQIHGLLGLWQKPVCLYNIGKEIGQVVMEESVLESIQTWKKFNRIRIDVDILKPLIPGLFLPKPGRDDLWIGIKFEKLPEFCYKCGIIGHLAKDCNLPSTILSNQFGARFPTFGDWLYADSDTYPPGIYVKVGETPGMNIPNVD